MENLVELIEQKIHKIDWDKKGYIITGKFNDITLEMRLLHDDKKLLTVTSESIPNKILIPETENPNIIKLYEEVSCVCDSQKNDIENTVMMKLMNL